MGGAICQIVRGFKPRRCTVGRGPVPRHFNDRGGQAPALRNWVSFFLPRGARACPSPYQRARRTGPRTTKLGILFPSPWGEGLSLATLTSAEDRPPHYEKTDPSPVGRGPVPRQTYIAGDRPPHYETGYPFSFAVGRGPVPRQTNDRGGQAPALRKNGPLHRRTRACPSPYQRARRTGPRTTKKRTPSP